MDATAIDRARQHLIRDGRVLERRIAGVVLDGEPPDAAWSAVRAYQNHDGGFGHGIEPDVASPTSQPLAAEVAWESLDWLGAPPPPDLLAPVCDSLAVIGAAVSCLTPAALGFPHAPHWTDASFDGALNPTAGLAGYLWRFGVDHRWRDDATERCWELLDAHGVPDDAHTAVGVVRLMGQLPDIERAGRVLEAIGAGLDRMRFLHLDPSEPGYGLTPLHLFPLPSPLRSRLVSESLIERHLDALEAAQEPDGGWPITWPTISPSAASAWRGRETVRALITLQRNGRLTALTAGRRGPGASSPSRTG